jgi:DNA polymerase (family X)
MFGFRWFDSELLAARSTMENPEVSQAFDEVADLLELQGANPFRIRAYRNAARTIRDLPAPLAEIAADQDRKLDDLPGIGADLAGKIKTLLETGELPIRQQLRREVPAGLPDLVVVPGLGPKRAQILFSELGIHSLNQLRKAALQHRVRKLKGFGEKSEAKILQGLNHVAPAQRRVYLAEAKVYADALTRHLRGASGVKEVCVAGSFRRRSRPEVAVRRRRRRGRGGFGHTGREQGPRCPGLRCR